MNDPQYSCVFGMLIIVGQMSVQDIAYQISQQTRNLSYAKVNIHYCERHKSKRTIRQISNYYHSQYDLGFFQYSKLEVFKNIDRCQLGLRKGLYIRVIDHLYQSGSLYFQF